MEIDRSSRTVFFQLDWEVWREKASVERGGEGREKGRTVIESNVQVQWKVFPPRGRGFLVPYRSKGNRLTKSLDKKPIDQFILFYFFSSSPFLSTFVSI